HACSGSHAMMLIETAPSLPSLSAATIETFQRDGFTVVEQVTTREDLEQISRAMARLYRRYNTLARMRRAWDLGTGSGEAGELPEILEINQTIGLEPELEATVTFRH